MTGLPLTKGLQVGGEGVASRIVGLLAAIDLYWLAAALALGFYGWQRRRGAVLTAVNTAVPWLVLRALGLLLLVLVPCLARNADAALGLLVALGLTWLLRLRLWQRRVCLAIIGVGAVAQALAAQCRISPGLLIAIGAALTALIAYRAARRWLVARGIWQRAASPVSEWLAHQARSPITPTLRAVLEARLRQHLGFRMESLEPLDAAGVHGSTPMVAIGYDLDGTRRRYLAKIVSGQNWQVNVAVELLQYLQNWRQRRLGRVLWPSLRALVEHEHYMLLFLADAGVPVPRPRGLYRLERSAYALVTDFMEGARSLRDVEAVSLDFVRQALLALRRMRELDCAHNDVKDSNILLLPGDRVAFVDAAMATSVAGPRRLAHDLADMLVCLARHHEKTAVVSAALDIIGEEGLRDARRYLRHHLLNSEMQKYTSVELPRELRRLVPKG